MTQIRIDPTETIYRQNVVRTDPLPETIIAYQFPILNNIPAPIKRLLIGDVDSVLGVDDIVGKIMEVRRSQYAEQMGWRATITKVTHSDKRFPGSRHLNFEDAPPTRWTAHGATNPTTDLIWLWLGSPDDVDAPFFGTAGNASSGTAGPLRQYTDQIPVPVHNDYTYFQKTKTHEVPEETEFRKTRMPLRKVMFKTRSGHTLWLSDDLGNEEMRLIDRAGQEIIFSCGVDPEENKNNKQYRGLKEAINASISQFGDLSKALDTDLGPLDPGIAVGNGFQIKIIDAIGQTMTFAAVAMSTTPATGLPDPNAAKGGGSFWAIEAAGGYIIIDGETGDIEVKNAGGARIVMTADQIHLNPLGG